MPIELLCVDQWALGLWSRRSGCQTRLRYGFGVEGSVCRTNEGVFRRPVVQEWRINPHRNKAQREQQTVER